MTTCRLLDESFLIDEELYIRLNPTGRYNFDNQAMGIVTFDDIRFPRCSVNRSKYSKPLDVLISGSEDWGVASFLAKAIPTPLLNPNNTEIRFDFLVFDDPIPTNAAHAEIRVFKNDSEVSNSKKISTLVKAEFRASLWVRTTLVKEVG